MALEYLGQQTLGACLPTALAASLNAQATLEAQLPAIALQLTAALTVQPPALVTDLIQNLLNLIAALQALLGSGVVIVPPSISVELGAQLQFQQATLSASIALQLQLLALFGVSGFYEYYYNGPVDEFGAAVNASLGAGLPGIGVPSQEVAALVIVCSEGPAIAALRTLAGL